MEDSHHDWDVYKYGVIDKIALLPKEPFTYITNHKK